MQDLVSNGYRQVLKKNMDKENVYKINKCRPRHAASDRFIQHGSNVLLAISKRRAENHYGVLQRSIPRLTIISQQGSNSTSRMKLPDFPRLCSKIPVSDVTTTNNIIICRLITRTMSEYMAESEARAVARWDVGSYLRMVHKTKQVGFEPVFENLHSWSISYGGWDFIPNLGGTVAVGTPTSQLLQLEH